MLANPNQSNFYSFTHLYSKFKQNLGHYFKASVSLFLVFNYLVRPFKVLRTNTVTLNASVEAYIPSLQCMLIPMANKAHLSLSIVFIVLVLVFLLQQRLTTEGRNDTLIGHVIVLLQYGWPREEGTFYELLDRIRDQGGLKYRVFFNYVNSILLSLLNSELTHFEGSPRAVQFTMASCHYNYQNSYRFPFPIQIL